MHIVLMNGTPLFDMLSHLLPFPFIINYQGEDVDDDCTILHAIQHHRHRVLRIVLQAPSLTLERLLVLMDKSFPRLESLTLLLTTKSGEGRHLMLPRTFLAPNLHHLSLGGISLPKGLPVLASTFSLVTLKLIDIQSPGYFTPATLASQLQQIPQLEELSIRFSTPLPCPGAKGESFQPPIMPIVLPALRQLAFRGVSVYLEDLVSWISSPLLRRCNIMLFNQLNFTLPHLSHFTRTTETLRHPIANVIFNHEGITFLISSHEEFNDGTFSLQVSCKLFDWQIDSATQLCSALLPVLSAVEGLMLDFDEEDLPSNWQDEVDAMMWHGLLWPFSGVKKLHIGYPLALELSNALESDNAGLVLGLLPELQELEAWVKLRHLNKAFETFIDARQLTGCHVHLLVSPAAKPVISMPVITPPFRSIPDEDEPLVSHPVPVQKNWFQRAIVKPVWRRLRSGTCTGVDRSLDVDPSTL